MMSEKVHPVITEEAAEVLGKYWLELRQNSFAGRNVTARQLEGLIRFAFAKARARLSTTVSVEDARVILTLNILHV